MYAFMVRHQSVRLVNSMAVFTSDSSRLHIIANVSLQKRIDLMLCEGNLVL